MLTRLIKAVLILSVVRVSAVSSDDLKATQTLNAARNAKSEEIRKYMNESADPCESFFDFACGNWKTHYPTNSSVTQTSALNMASQYFEHKLPQLLTTVDEMDTEAELKAKHFYESCMTLTSITQEDYKAKLKGIVSEFGHMPILEGDTWQEQDFDWLKTVAEISYKYGIQIILGSTIFRGDNDPTENELCISSPTFRLAITEEIVEKLKTFLAIEDQMAEQMAKEILDFDDILFRATGNDTKLKPITMEDVHNKYLSDFDAKNFINISYGSIPAVPIRYEYIYMDSLFDIVKRTPKRVVANYIFYHLLLDFMENIVELQGACIAKIKNNFPNVVNYMFYRKNDLRNAEQDVERMWQNVKTTLQTILESRRLSWFNDHSREYALEKLPSLKMVVNSYKENNLDAEYALLIIDKQDYLENRKSLKSFYAGQTRAALNELPRYTDLVLDQSTPLYVPQSNTIVIPVSVLQNDFFYSKFYPVFLHLAHLGAIVGHEVLHGFSGEGRRDEDIEQEEYDEERRQCLYDQYHKYTFGGIQLPQDKSQRYNAADVGGVLLAYETYRRWYEDEGRTKEELDLESLPNLNYTNNQLFFIYYSQMWCADTREDVRSHLYSDGYSPAEFRAFVPLKNIEQFSNAFKCPIGTAMNPAEKCGM